jgi:O-antigen ligase
MNDEETMEPVLLRSLEVQDTWQQEAAHERTPLIIALVAIFIVASCTVGELTFWHNVTKAIGAVLAFAFLIQAMRKQFRVCPEVILFGSWVVWALVPLLAGNAYPQLFWSAWSTVVLTWVAFLILAQSTETHRILSINLIAFLVAAVIVGMYSVVTGEFRRAELEGGRVEGMALNSNTFGFRMLLATIALAYLWVLPMRTRKLAKIIIIVGMVLSGLATIASGSRKALLGLVAFYILWVFFCYRKEMVRRPSMLLGVLLSLGIGGVALVYTVQESVVGQRLEQTYKGLTGQYSRESGMERVVVYKKAFVVLGEHPFVGVGLASFRIYAGSKIGCHSDLMDVATTTGVPGLILYSCIFVIMWWRAGRVAKYSDDPLAVRIAQLFQATLIVMVLEGLGRYNYSSKEYWVVMGSFIGYTHAVWQDIKARGLNLLPQGATEHYGLVTGYP